MTAVFVAACRSIACSHLLSHRLFPRGHQPKERERERGHETRSRVRQDRTEQRLSRQRFFDGKSVVQARRRQRLALSLSLSSFERKDETSGGAHTTAAAVAAALHSMMQADGSWQARLHRLCAIVVTIVLIAISF